MDETAEAEEIAELEKVLRATNDHPPDGGVPYGQLAKAAAAFMRGRLVDATEFDLNGDDLRKAAEVFLVSGGEEIDGSLYDPLSDDERGRIIGQLHLLAGALDARQREVDHRERQREIQRLDGEIATQQQAHLNHIREGAAVYGSWPALLGIGGMWLFRGWGSLLAWLAIILVALFVAAYGANRARRTDENTMSHIRNLERRRDALSFGESER